MTIEQHVPIQTRAISVTDDKGKIMLPSDQMHEPLPGSVVLTSGHHGTAWQRHFADGLWYPTTTGCARSWQWITGRRNVVLIYDAPERDS